MHIKIMSVAQMTASMRQVLSNEEKAAGAGRRRKLWAVYLGPYTSNGKDRIGVGQGGAQASLFGAQAHPCSGVSDRWCLRPMVSQTTWPQSSPTRRVYTPRPPA